MRPPRRLLPPRFIRKGTVRRLALQTLFLKRWLAPQVATQSTLAPQVATPIYWRLIWWTLLRWLAPRPLLRWLAP